MEEPPPSSPPSPGGCVGDFRSAVMAITVYSELGDPCNLALGHKRNSPLADGWVAKDLHSSGGVGNLRYSKVSKVIQRFEGSRRQASSILSLGDLQSILDGDYTAATASKSGCSAASAFGASIPGTRRSRSSCGHQKRVIHSAGSQPTTDVVETSYLPQTINVWVEASVVDLNEFRPPPKASLSDFMMAAGCDASGSRAGAIGKAGSAAAVDDSNTRQLFAEMRDTAAVETAYFEFWDGSSFGTRGCSLPPPPLNFAPHSPKERVVAPWSIVELSRGGVVSPTDVDDAEIP